MRRRMVGLAVMAVLGLAGCTPASQNPDAVRQQTANATAAATRTTKAVVQGVFDGLKAKGPMNINKASREDLETLPGVDEAVANRIIAGRPYGTSAELVKRRIVSKTQYDRMATKIEAR